LIDELERRQSIGWSRFHKKTQDCARGFSVGLHYYNSVWRIQLMSGQPQLMIVAEDSAHESDQDRAQCSDALLLDAWTRHQDADAFAALVRRYSALVLGVCRRQSRCREDAEDAFQATFLILSRSARRLRHAERLAGWLHQVAYRAACRGRARGRKAMDTLIEDPVDQHDSLNEIARRHRLRALDEELGQLPEHYRNAIVLHYFEGLTYDQTAAHMGSSEPSIRGCLQRAKQRLHSRLIGRGVSLSLAFAAVMTSSSREAAAAGLVQRTVQLAGDTAGGAPIDPNLKYLLAKESPIVFSPAVLTTACAAAFSLAGLLVAQISAPQLNEKPSAVTLRGEGPASAEPSTIQAEVDPFDYDTQSSGSPQATDDPDEMMDMAGGMGMMGGMSMGMGGMGMASGQPKSQRPINSWSTSNPQAYERIESELAKSTSLSFLELPLEDVVKELQHAHNVPIVIDLRALEEIGHAPDLAVSYELANVSLESALNMILDEVDLTFTIDNEVLCITTEEADDANHQLLRVYWSSQSGLQADDGSSELIQTMVEPESWSAMGGQGDISILGAKEDEHSGLAVRATYQTHRKIEQFLESIRSGTSQAVSGIQAEATGMYGTGDMMSGSTGMMSGRTGMLSGSSGSGVSAGAGGLSGGSAVSGLQGPMNGTVRGRSGGRTSGQARTRQQP
jgi:RNA polymerase sigma factor (sigma-70 family)